MRFRALVLAALLATPAAAQDWVAGIEATSDTSYTYVTHYTRSGPVTFWQTVSFLRYSVREAGGTTQIESPGIATGLTYRWTQRNWSAAAGAGYEMRWTDRLPPGGVSTTERQQGPIVEGDVFQRLSARTSVRGAARWSGANDWRAGSFEVRREIRRALRAGPQVVWQGNDEIQVFSVGAFAETPLGNSALQLRAGQARIAHRDGTRATQPYFSVGIVVPF
ncbi:MAG TPA: hypothetical protein VNA04_05340 [Thermoanaerobaculia bacterium]|nr:hypothetical protein [Thermoanaerobaculia bacterium]